MVFLIFDSNLNMKKLIRSTEVPEEKIISKIYLIRGKKVMLDRDLAELYKVETRILNQAVKRNESRFPADFMFRLTAEELKDWKSQNVTSNKEKMGLRKLPLAFTEQGVAMLSSVLNSETAIDVNIQIIRIFSRIRELLITHTEILIKLEQLEKKFIIQDSRMDKHDEDVQNIFAVLKELINEPNPPRPRIGFRRNKEED